MLLFLKGSIQDPSSHPCQWLNHHMYVNKSKMYICHFRLPLSCRLKYPITSLTHHIQQPKSRHELPQQTCFSPRVLSIHHTVPLRIPESENHLSGITHHHPVIFYLIIILIFTYSLHLCHFHLNLALCAVSNEISCWMVCPHPSCSPDNPHPTLQPE